MPKLRPAMPTPAEEAAALEAAMLRFHALVGSLYGTTVPR